MLDRLNVILLDVDGCILPNTRNSEDDFIIFGINLKNLKELCLSSNLKIVIISSMSSRMVYHKGRIKREDINIFCPHDDRAIAMMSTYISDVTIDVAKGNKESTIKRYISDNDIGKVIVLDDTNFSHNVNHNNGSYYVPMNGYLSGKDISIINKIISK